MRYELPILNYYLLCYFNTTIQLLNQIITVSLSGNREYNTGSKDTTNANQPDLLSAFSKVESNLIQNVTNLKDEVVNLKGIINKNLQDENMRLKIKKMFWKKKLLIWKSKTTMYIVVEISGIHQSVSDNQLEQNVVDILKAIDVNITTNEIEKCY